MTENELRDELDERFLRRQWVVQRVGWGLMLVVMLLAVVGVLGTSPWAAQVQTKDVGGAHYEVESARFTRYQLVEHVHVRVDAPQATGDELKIAFSRDWVENNMLRGSTPAADGGGFAADGATYTYTVDSWTEPMTVLFELETRKAFRSSGTLSIQAGEQEPVAFDISAWVNP